MKRLLLCFSALLLLFTSCSKIRPDAVRMAQGDTVYLGTMKDSLRQGYGVLYIKGIAVYAGEWDQGRRHGHALSHDSVGNLVTGTWRNERLIEGSKRDSLGLYSGDMTAKGVPNGYGIRPYADGSYYEGVFEKGQRQGLGFGISPRTKLQMGEWKANTYKGERLEYTSKRIYGIDISRFQHDIGRRSYPIDWTKLRITGLGTLSKKQVRGQVDYPIRFCYIKSTEGTTLRNRYYLKDYRAARARGIRCGAYHFFSTTSPASKQAAHFLKYSKFQRGDLPPVLDVEPLPSQIRKMGGTEKLFQAVRTWMRTVEQRVGVRPILYISQSFVNKYLPQAPDIERRYQVWIARYGEYKPDVRLAIWQLSPDGKVSGIRPAVDINVFNGYESQYQNFLETQCIK